MIGRALQLLPRAETPSGLLADDCRQFGQFLGLTAAPKQVKAASGVVRRFLWAESIDQAGDLTTAAIQDYLGRLLAAGGSLKTAWNHRSAISAFCGFLCDRGLLKANPCHAVKLRRPDEQLPRWLTDDEIEQVLHLATQHGIWPEVVLALSTGLRLSEMIRLRWDDIDLPRRALTVRKAKGRRPRVLPLSRSALEALEAQRLITGGFGYVFPARQTWRGGWRYVDRPRASNWWRRVLRPLQDALPKFLAGTSASATGRGWHLLRHTFASRAAQGRGGRPAVSLYKLADWLGHRDVRTVRIYAHLQEGYDPDVEAASL